ncbi:MAG: hypothetical protein A2750_00195 [Candidatus Yanofskybacteria bacterium RIFCSPHIGHO2_01_FULL_45_42]|uniref:GH26 domain-containing protein n=3 Tax=Candidatus Yanofskyibacteriota TaxID=1752733 RepID=A0A1F8H3X8_9BACT|nr:MAG: hypothetical protein A2750_00195 [Candidatus Yanofskybacteria bacterium RIFCSPHIGHO2_01_FULL_45_42]OGN15854.1 MAG: hypothetical protein A3C81_02050 [Candidatus Yanofskybacteria bacterium RIFCSPHIGHO2_02_FULL_46_19]OGN27431.1 MAG: hypothetical protein A3B17_01505 [Candidatus Yanofskybacteria bacterium RIFCSPLOWO2_01_FULL_45_72]OGN32292.1 MAG: hypothetical protein A3J01_02415 [Candidatus Yanofskybacteria bacterium RIFCSPLOWO2_02_FULL_45_18]
MNRGIAPKCILTLAILILLASPDIFDGAANGAAKRQKQNKHTSISLLRRETDKSGYGDLAKEIRSIIYGRQSALDKSGLASANSTNSDGTLTYLTSFYTWYHPNQNRNIGQMGTIPYGGSIYNSCDKEIAKWQLRDMAEYLGPNAAVLASWFNPPREEPGSCGYEEINFMTGFLEAKKELAADGEPAGNIKYAFLYELAWFPNNPKGYEYTVEKTPRGDSYWIDFAKPFNQKLWARDLAYLKANHFDRDDFLKINGKPVLMFWVPIGLNMRYAKAIADHITGTGVFLVNCLGTFSPPNFGSTDAKLKEQLLYMDAVSSYVAYSEEMAVQSGNELTKEYIEAYALSQVKWFDYLQKNVPHVTLIPPLTFHMDDTKIPDRINSDGSPMHPPLFCTNNENRLIYLRAISALVRRFNLPGFVNIGTWNELWEGTTVERTETYGLADLEALKQFSKQ